MACSVSVSSRWLIVLFKYSELLQSFCLLLLTIVERELLELLTIFVDLPISLCNCISFTLCVLLNYEVPTHSGFLCLAR